MPHRHRQSQAFRRIPAQGAPADGNQKPLSLVLCDIDFFKRFNDTWGHQTGDPIIRFVAGCLTRHSDDAHLVARYSGGNLAL